MPERLYHLTLAAVQKELNLSEEQVKQVQSQAAEWRDARTTAAARPQLTAAMNEAIDKMLKPEQQQRLRQIGWQQIQKRGMTLLLTTAEFTKALGLSDKQQETAAAVRKEHTAVINILDRELFRPGADGNKAFQQASQALSKRTEGRLMALLSKEQQTRMTEILGRTFEGTIPTQSPFGGGGPGGGGVPRPGMQAFDPPL